MRPVDHFFSQLAQIERSQPSSELALDRETADHLIREFSRLLTGVIGGPAAEDLCFRILERIQGKKPELLQKVGNIAAFFLGEFDDTLDLDEDDWTEIQETLEDASEEIDIDTLTALMGELLAVGKLK
ncbi:hypothetical protein LQZ21_10565 [Treponema sp. TIM-1]|uniref:hypothetical protein n=1 Tax=Treponema sp. TIM-1 TaxID=2898417 RepID=UPI003980F1E8